MKVFLYGMVSDSERAALVNAAAELEAETVEFLKEMVRTPSVNPPGDYEDIHSVIVSEFERHAWDTETIWAPDSLLEELGITSPRPNIVSSPVRNGTPAIALNAHHDTVPVDESEWSFDPFGAEEEDGFVYGRGVKDCKGRIASYTLAVRLLEETDLLPDNVTIQLVITADEETGGQAGTGYVVEEGEVRPNYAIVEGNIDQVRNAGAGILRYKVTIEGKSAHAARPQNGVNALFGAGRVITAIETYAEKLLSQRSRIDGIRGPTCTPATIEGGLETNIVPSSCSFTVDQRVPPDYDIEEMERDFREVVDSVTLPDGATVTVGRTHKSSPYLFESDEIQIQAVKRNAEAILGKPVPTQGSAGSTDSRYFEPVGTKCVNYGPGDDSSNSHGADENISIEQVRTAGAIVAASIIDIADGHTR
jgi:acetylornithine deacetylase/succinyl-diaminopimelate desuccinylase family protein